MSETTGNNDKITDGNGNNVSHIPNVSGKWVSVKERLPYEDGNSDIWCLVYGNNRISLHPYNEHHKCWDDEEGDDYWTDATDGKVTHWMSLPEKPISEIKPANTVKEQNSIKEKENFESILKWLHKKNYQSYGHSFDTHEIACMIEDYVKEELKV